jgi:hypothetical protein
MAPQNNKELSSKPDGATLLWSDVEKSLKDGWSKTLTQVEDTLAIVIPNTYQSVFQRFRKSYLRENNDKLRSMRDEFNRYVITPKVVVNDIITKPIGSN